MADSRFPPTPTSKLQDEYKKYGQDLYDFAAVVFGDSGKLLEYKDEKDALIGPFPFLIASKQTGAQFVALNKAYSELQGFPADAREVAILTIGARYQAAYELYAHKSVAVRSNLLSQEQVDLISTGKKPDDLNENCSITYDTVYHLANTPGPLPQGLFDRCVEAFGRDGTLCLTHYAGMYAYTCILLNVADAWAPEK